MADQEIGYVELTATTRIIFSVGSWKGQARGGIRKFVTTDKYSGPTKSGMSLDGQTAAQLLGALRALQSTVPRNDQDQHVSVGKTRDWELRVSIIAPDENNGLPSVDMREFVDTPRYAGPTKAGVRFSWDKLTHFTQLVEVLVQQLGVAVSSEPTLFPDMQPKWVDDAKSGIGRAAQQPSPCGLDPATLNEFPGAFLPDEHFEVENLNLPLHRLKVGQDRNANYFVTDNVGFERKVRNEVEGKFFVYAQLRRVTELDLPKEMFKVFSAVARYEKYCRELHQKIIKDLEVSSGNRTLAEHMAGEAFQTHGLPYVSTRARVEYIFSGCALDSTGVLSNGANQPRHGQKSLRDSMFPEAVISNRSFARGGPKVT